jgi:hypothetical protein
MKNLVVTFFPFLFLSIAFAAGPVIHVDKSEGTLEDVFSVQIEVEGRGEPQIEWDKTFRVEKYGTSSSFTLINGKASSKTIYSFMLYPSLEGEFTIGPANITENGQKISGNFIRLRVAKTEAAVSPSSSSSGSTQKITAPNGSYKLEAKLDKASGYVGEEVLYTLRLMLKVPINEPRLSLPDFQGFWKEETGKERQYEQIINGESWTVIDIKMALFPSGAGAKIVGKAGLDFSISMENTQPRRRGGWPFSDFFDMMPSKRVSLSSDPVSLDVKELPSLSEIGTFNTGLVGEFSLETAVGKKELAAGDSTTLTVTLKGRGNIWDAKFPTLNLAGVKVYEDKPQVDIERGPDGVGGTKTFKFALVPSKEGSLTIEPIEMFYWDTTLNRYKKLVTRSLTLNVAPGIGETPRIEKNDLVLTETKKNVLQLNQDLMPLKTDSAGFISNSPGRFARMFIIFCIVVMPLIVLFSWIGFQWEEMFFSDEVSVRRRRALGRFKKDLSKLSQDSHYIESISIFLRRYLGDRLSIDGMSLTSADARSRLEEEGLSHETAGNIVEVLKICEMSIYGHGDIGAPAREKVDHLVHRIASNVEREAKK